MTSSSEMTIDQAIKSKAAFIQYIHHIELASIRPDVVDLLEMRFTDEMANNFLEFFNGSNDDVRIVLENGEVLPSLVDDIKAIINAYENKNTIYTFNPAPFINEYELSM